MNRIKKCKECGSNRILITSDPKGHIFAVTCQECGWEYESDEFKTLAAEVDDVINNFDRIDLLNTKTKLI